MQARMLWGRPGQAWGSFSWTGTCTGEAGVGWVAEVTSALATQGGDLVLLVVHGD